MNSFWLNDLQIIGRKLYFLVICFVFKNEMKLLLATLNCKKDENDIAEMQLQ